VYESVRQFVQNVHESWRISADPVADAPASGGLPVR